MSNKICLYGASGHGKVVHDIIKSIGKVVEVFLDDNPMQKEMHNVPIYSSNLIDKYLENTFIISIGNNFIRKKISEQINVNFVDSVVHSSAVVSNSVTIDVGTVVMPLAVINSDTRVGKHAIINSAAVVEHDCVIGDYVHISPNASLAGGVSVGEGTQVGIGASIIPQVKIGKWSIIGAGATVINEVPDYAVVVGSPAVVIKKNEIGL